MTRLVSEGERDGLEKYIAQGTSWKPIWQTHFLDLVGNEPKFPRTSKPNRTISHFYTKSGFRGLTFAIRRIYVPDFCEFDWWVYEEGERWKRRFSKSFNELFWWVKEWGTARDSFGQYSVVYTFGLS